MNVGYSSTTLMAISRIDDDTYSVVTNHVPRGELDKMYGMSVIYDGRCIPIFRRMDIDHMHIPVFRDNYEAMFGRSKPIYEVRGRINGSEALYVNEEILMGSPYDSNILWDLEHNGYFQFLEYCTIPPDHAHDVIAALYRGKKETGIKKI